MFFWGTGAFMQGHIYAPLAAESIGSDGRTFGHAPP